MDEQSERTALLSALTTEHFVLQTANNSTYSEASARSTLYVMALSSSLVAMGFVAGSTDLLIPFAAIVAASGFRAWDLHRCKVGRNRAGKHAVPDTESPASAVTTARSVPRLRATSAPEYGRWPEVEPPALRLGPALAFFGTTASMIAVINNVVAGVGIALLTRFLSPSAPSWVDAVAGIAGALILTWLFYVYQRWRFDDYDARDGERG